MLMFRDSHDMNTTRQLEEFVSVDLIAFAYHQLSRQLDY